MCMSCHGNNRKRIAIIAGAGDGAVDVITYVSLVTNPVAAPTG
jgi:thioredoxin reductase